MSAPSFSAFATRHRLALGVVSTIVLVMVGFAALLDWNWLRSPLQRFVSSRTGMSLTLGTLDVHVFRGLHAIARDVQLGEPNNSSAPLLSARAIELRVAPAPLLRGRLVLRYLSLTDARVDLQRDAEGKVNWSREAQPKPASGPKGPLTLPFQIDALALNNVEVRYADVPRNVDVHTRVASNAVASATRRTRIQFDGAYAGDRFEGTALTGELLTLQNTAQPFPVDVQVSAGRTKVAAVGQISDLLGNIGVDGSLRISGTSLASLYPTLPVALPSTPPYTIEGHLNAQENQYEFNGIRGRIGQRYQRRCAVPSRSRARFWRPACAASVSHSRISGCSSA